MRINKNKKEFEMIEKISKGLNLSKKRTQTVLQIAPSEVEDTKLLQLVEGSWKGIKDSCLVFDEKQNLYALLSVESLARVIDRFQKAEQEVLSLKLEKSILQHLPLDFYDVWTVAMKEIEKSKNSDIDFDKLVLNIKKSHPNLFLDLKDLQVPEGASIISTIHQ